MGSDYSRMQGTQFPPGYFCIGFRQPDMLQILHAGTEIIGLVKQLVQTQWVGGIKTEKRYSLGIELRLAHDPFSNDCNNMEKVINSYKFVCVLLEELLNHGFQVINKGYFIKGIERNMWIMYDPHHTNGARVGFLATGEHDEEQTPISIGNNSVAVVGLEDWNKIITVNCTTDTFNSIQSEVDTLWSLGITKSNLCADYGCLELGGQPFDSYKSESEKTPLICLKIVEVMASKGYRLFLSTHVRGIIDTLFFLHDPSVTVQPMAIMSLNQQDQLRFYNASSTVVKSVSRVIRENWEKGIIGDELTGPIWVVRLKGSPWWVPEWDKDTAINGRQLICQIITELRSLGWRIHKCIELYRSQYDKSLFILNPEKSPSAAPHLFVSSHDVDRLCISGGSESLQELLKSEIRSHWSRGVREDAMTPGYLEFFLEGKPWLWDLENCTANLEGIGILCWVHEVLLRQGWELVVDGADISSSTKYSPHTWIYSTSPGNASDLKFSS